MNCHAPAKTSDMVLKVAYGLLLVLGFPMNLSHEEILPIWKRASVATEPDIPHDNLPVFLIDTATREGMSGAPVIHRSFGNYTTTTGGNVMQGGEVSRFVGALFRPLQGCQRAGSTARSRVASRCD